MRYVAAVPTSHQERFWDARARENPYYFIDNRQAFATPDVERFWSDGERDLMAILDAAGVSLTGEESAVEIGCGIGRLTRALARRTRAVVALDVSSEMLRRAREHNRELHNVHWLHCDGRTLSSLPDAAFDACVSHVVFQHIPDPEVTLGYVREIGRVLRPGGWTVFQVSNDPAVHSRSPTRTGIRSRLSSAIGREPRGQHDPAWLGSSVTLEALRDAAHRGCLDVERILNPGTQYCLVRARRRATTR